MASKGFKAVEPAPMVAAISPTSVSGSAQFHSETKLSSRDAERGIRMFRYIRTAMHEAKDAGASAVEYALMVAAIAAVIVAVVFGLGTVISNTFNKSCSAITKGNAATGGTDCAGATPLPANGG